MSKIMIDFSKTLDDTVLRDQSVLVTGGASGIGRGIVEAVARVGAYVTVADFNKGEGNKVAQELTSQGLHVNFIETDVTSFSSQTAAFKAAINFSPSHSLDIVIPSAGLAGSTIMQSLGTDLSEASFSSDPPHPKTSVLETNLMGVYYSVHLALYYFAASLNAPHQAVPHPSTRSSSITPGQHRKKHLLLVSSLAAYLTQPLAADYAAAKFGTRGLFKALRNASPTLFNHSVDDLHAGMRVNLLAPTLVYTPMTIHETPMAEQIDIRIATVADVVAGAMRLLTDESIEARAMAVYAARDGEAAGSANVDLQDEYEHFDGMPRVLQSAVHGGFGEGFWPYTGADKEVIGDLVRKSERLGII